MTAIEFENISKQYRLGLVSTRTISHDLNRWFAMNIRGKEDPYLKIGETNDRSIKGDSDYVWALKDINFKIEQGDVVGIIGKNGAGKSTLLKILSKVTAPSTGVIRARGRIASLLEVGTGFHPEMTGRENIYMNGSIMGMTKREITSKLDEIVDFSGCERYLDTPVKRYSSGMMVRLGFAIAAHLEPEILVVDEVLAVGDAEFQKKAIGKMQDVSKGEGRTVLFVSHNMAAVKSLCTSGIVLHNGQIMFSGLVDEAINKYMNESVDLSDRLIKDTFIVKNENLVINSFLVNGTPHNHIILSKEKNQLHFKIEGEIKTDMKLSLEMRIFDENDIPLAYYSPYHSNSPLLSKGNFTIENTLHFAHGVNRGRYFANLFLTNSMVEGYADSYRGLLIESEGYPTDSGFVFDYASGHGWLFYK